ncbi:MAG TPA: Zn-dependent hydrolase, partial [Bacteroidales bacterium]|nr:Zn-dependent hydrolase [Bacteroidales bacterium]
MAAMKEKVEEYAVVKLTTDLSRLTEKERQMLPLLFKAANIMDELYWLQTFGNKEELLSKLDTLTRRFAEINYGPWDRLNNNKPFVEGIGEKPLGANFYPKDMTTEEFEKLANPAKASLYTLIQRDENNQLIVVPYSVAYKEQLTKASALLLQAAALAENSGLKNYLQLRAKALITDNYYESDLGWMDMKDNHIDFIIGSIENYEDQLFGYKTSFESFILVKDREWTDKIQHIATLLPKLQKSLSVPDAYKTEIPASTSDLGVYDAIYYAGDCNAGSKTIAINLPNDPQVQKLKGSRRLQLKNTMQAKFDRILLPIASIVFNPSQMKYIKFDAFFENVMFHEIAHGLGVHQTIKEKVDVREALKDTYSTLEEAKADITGLHLITTMHTIGEMSNRDLMENYVTFLAGIFRSVRFGASSAHGKANMIQFNYFLQNEAIKIDPSSGTYSIDFEKMKKAVSDLSALIIQIQGDGDYQRAKQLIADMGNIPPKMQTTLD